MQYIHSSHILLMSERAVTAHSLEEPKVERWLNKACSWVQDKAKLGGGRTRDNTPHNWGQNAGSLWLLPRITEEILQLKQKFLCARISHSSVIKQLLSIPGQNVCILKKNRTENRFRILTHAMPSLCYRLSVISLRPLAHKHIQIFCFWDKHDTISVNKEHLKYIKRKCFWGILFVRFTLFHGFDLK